MLTSSDDDYYRTVPTPVSLKRGNPILNGCFIIGPIIKAHSDRIQSEQGYVTLTLSLTSKRQSRGKKRFVIEDKL
jgi:hypothetical protein